MNLPSWLKPAAWGVVIGALGWWAVLSWGFGWVSADTAQKMVADQTQTAVIAAVTPECVARFEQQPNALVSWKALKKSADDYNQSDFIQKGGWANLPGQKLDSDTIGGIASACATELLALKDLNGVKLSGLK